MLGILKGYMMSKEVLKFLIIYRILTLETLLNKKLVAISS
jgi:hypothetical protein